MGSEQGSSHGLQMSGQRLEMSITVPDTFV